MHASRPVLIRDFFIFMVKLILDALKDVFLFKASIVAILLDMFFGGKRRRIFYAVMRWGERFDLWLNLHGALSNPDDESDDGLFGASRAGSDTLLGKLEQTVRGGDQPRGGRRGRSGIREPKP